jgi:hypothetical protein
MALGIARTATADPKRERPDYDGRGNVDAEPPGGAWWIPRVLLAPLYLVNEVVLRWPIGALISAAERDRWVDTVSDTFRFGRRNNYLVMPTALFDFGLLPSVGLQLSGDDMFATGNAIVLHVATWGPQWLNATMLDRYTWHDGRSRVTARVDIRRTADSLFFGIGPDVTSATRSRYALQRLDSHVSVKQALVGESGVSLYTGVRTTWYRDGTCCDDPPLARRVAEGSLPEPPGYGVDYTSIYQRVDVTLDSRAPRPAPATGVYLNVHGEPSIDLGHGRSWIRYGGLLGGVIDVNARQRALGLRIGAEFVDPISTNMVPFNELAGLGSDLMPGFVDGWMIGRSAIASQLSYTWPVAVWLDGEARLSAGNAFGDHLEGFALDKLRLSGAVGVTSTGARDQGFELLFGLGTETIEQGEHITSVRLTIGSRRGF